MIVRRGLALAVAAAVLAVATLAALAAAREIGHPTGTLPGDDLPSGVAAAPRAAGWAPGGAADTGTPPAPDRPGGEVPDRLIIPTIGVDAALAATGLNPDRTVAVPPLTQVGTPSWFDYSPPPGDVGPAVVLGHVNGGGTPGVFADLTRLARGDTVHVRRRDGRDLRFVVDRSRTVAKAAFPTDAVYGDTTRPELRLITCGGQLDRAAHSYLSNVIVFAHLEAS